MAVNVSKTDDAPTPANGVQRPDAGPVLRGDLDMRIDRASIWYYHGSPIGRKELVRLFSSALTRDKAGEYWLITPTKKGRIRVEDAPFLAVELFPDGGGRDQVISFRTNIDEIVIMDEAHPLDVVANPKNGGPSPYLTVRGGLTARIARSVYYELVDLGEEQDRDGERVFGVWSSGTFFFLGKLDGAS